MKTLQENEGYDVPWEFVRRRATRSPTGTTTTAPAIDHGSTTAAGVAYRSSNNENDMFQQAARIDKTAIGKRTNGRFSAGDDPSVNGRKRDNGSIKREMNKPPIAAPKPVINSNGVCSTTATAANGSDFSSVTSSSSTTTTCIFNKMPGDSMNSVITSNTPPCGIRAQRIRKERYASGGCTPVGSVSASPALSRNAPPNETADELASCVVWEYRKPEHDARPSSEYDAPWDCKRLSSGRETPSCSCPSAVASGASRRSTDGDAIYDEPWDVQKGDDPIKKAVLGLSMRSAAKGDSNGMGSNNSPSSTSRSSDSRGSAATASSSDNDRSYSRATSQYPDAVSVNSGGSPAINGQEGRNGIEKRTNGSAKTPVHFETAFCSKPSATAAANVASKKRFQDKDKLIQQLCSGDAVIAPVRQSVARRSMNNAKHLGESRINGRRGSDEKQRGDQEGMVTTSTSTNDDENLKSEIPIPDYDTPWEFSNSPETTRMVREMKNVQHAQPTMQQPGIAKKPEPKSKLNRQHLSLNFGCAGLNPTSTKIDTALPLNEQMWYHGNITRAEAEQRLSKAVEGSFLVRVCESSTRHGDEYALSLKSAKGFMHMKIQQDPQRNWILGYFSQPFESVPVMIRYYSVNKLPIKGAEHMRLLRPVADQVL